MNRLFILSIPEARQRAMECVKEAPEGYVVKVSQPTRNLEQNAAQWPILECFAKQKQWPINGNLEWMTKEEWKDVLTAAFEKESIRLAASMNGGVVMLGSRTSKYGKKKFSEWLEFLNAAAVELNVDLSTRIERDYSA